MSVAQTVVCSSAKWNFTDFLLDRPLLDLSIDLLGERSMYLLGGKSINLVAEKSIDVLDGKFGRKSMDLPEEKSIDLVGKKSWPAS